MHKSRSMARSLAAAGAACLLFAGATVAHDAVGDAGSTDPALNSLPAAVDAWDETDRGEVADANDVDDTAGSGEFDETDRGETADADGQDDVDEASDAEADGADEDDQGENEQAGDDDQGENEQGDPKANAAHFSAVKESDDPEEHETENESGDDSHDGSHESDDHGDSGGHEGEHDGRGDD